MRYQLTIDNDYWKKKERRKKKWARARERSAEQMRAQKIMATQRKREENAVITSWYVYIQKKLQFFAQATAGHFMWE